MGDYTAMQKINKKKIDKSPTQNQYMLLDFIYVKLKDRQN